MQKKNTHKILKQPKNIVNILKGAPCGKSLNYIIYKMQLSIVLLRGNQNCDFHVYPRENSLTINI